MDRFLDWFCSPGTFSPHWLTWFVGVGLIVCGLCGYGVERNHKREAKAWNR